MYLAAEGNEDAIKEGNTTSGQQKPRTLIFLCHHINDALKIEYLSVKNPLVLWNKFKERYMNLKAIIIPKARYDWMHLRLQDFKSVSAYNFEVYKITSQLELCEEKVTDERPVRKNILNFFHASNMLLLQQYREKGFKKYSELISCLLVVEQNNELLMKNHEARSVGVAPFPEVNASQHNHFGKARGRGNVSC